MPTARSQSISLVLHIFTLALLLLLTSQSFITTPPALSIPNLTRAIPLTLPLPKINLTEQEGGGSNSSPLPARRGAAPQRAARPFIPPELHPDPKLPINTTIDFDAPLLAVADATIGDPLSKVPGYGLGNQGGQRIGSLRDGPGIGDKSGIKGSGRLGAPIKPAEVIYKVDPEFSEDARRAKFQGVVVLMIEIGTDGRAHNAEVVEDPGLGLSQKAIEAVTQWRFRPAQKSGNAIASTARVEVHFHLM